MHQQSLEVFTELFRKRRGDERLSILDVGSLDVNGTYHSVFLPRAKSYIGIDLQAGPNVDIVLENPYQFPLADNSFDLVISGQALEHSECFWLVIDEMVRCCKPGGYIIIIVPSAGAIHRYPVDCYRFNEDAFIGWAKYWKLDLIKLIHKTDASVSQWCDLAGLFKKLSLSPIYQIPHQ